MQWKEEKKSIYRFEPAWLDVLLTAEPLTDREFNGERLEMSHMNTSSYESIKQTIYMQVLWKMVH